MAKNIYQNKELIFCSFFPVGLEDYIIYFKKNFKEFVYLGWKFPHTKTKNSCSFIQYYRDGQLIQEKKLYTFPPVKSGVLYFLFLPFNYLFYFFQALKIFLKKKNPGDITIFMGVNYFCTFCGVVLKKLGKIDYIIYRVMDFFPLPKKGPYRLLVRFFYILDKICLKHSDSIWFTTVGHIIGREKYGYFNRKQYCYQIIPLGLDVSKFISKPITPQNKYSLVYCGVISKYHLLGLVFDVMQELRKNFKEIKLNLIGSGPDEEYFKNLAKKMGLEKNIVFHGFLEESEKFRNLMADNLLGFALYQDEENFMKYTEPAKVKYYLNYGVPAIISKVPKIAEELDSKKVSFAVENNKEEIVKTINDFIANPILQQEYKNNIKNFIKTVNIDYLLYRTFQQTFRYYA